MQLRFEPVAATDIDSLHAQNIYQQVVVRKLMPMNNVTGITDA